MQLPLINIAGRCILLKSQSKKFQRGTLVFCSELYIFGALFHDYGMYDDAHVQNTAVEAKMS